MPNPFIKGGPANTSKDGATDRTPIAPVPEQYEGANLPYRGVMYHGVEPTERPQHPVGYSDQVEVDYLDEPEEQHAVPVRVVNQSDRFFRDARADYLPLTQNVPMSVAAREDSRISLTIVNPHETETVWIGFSANMTEWRGSFPLLHGEKHTLVTKDEVYVMGTAASMTVGWLAEYEIPMDDD